MNPDPRSLAQRVTSSRHGQPTGCRDQRRTALGNSSGCAPGLPRNDHRAALSSPARHRRPLITGLVRCFSTHSLQPRARSPLPRRPRVLHHTSTTKTCKCSTRAMGAPVVEVKTCYGMHHSEYGKHSGREVNSPLSAHLLVLLKYSVWCLVNLVWFYSGLRLIWTHVYVPKEWCKPGAATSN